MQTKVTLTDRNGHILKSILLPRVGVSSHMQEAIGKAKQELLAIKPDGYTFVTHVGNGAENN